MRAGLSLNHLVRTQQQRLRDRESERLRGPEIDDQLDLVRLKHRKIAGFRALEDPAGVDAGLATDLSEARSVAHQPAGSTHVEARGDGMARGLGTELFIPAPTCAECRHARPTSSRSQSSTHYSTASRYSCASATVDRHSTQRL